MLWSNKGSHNFIFTQIIYLCSCCRCSRGTLNQYGTDVRTLINDRNCKLFALTNILRAFSVFFFFCFFFNWLLIRALWMQTPIVSVPNYFFVVLNSFYCFCLLVCFFIPSFSLMWTSKHSWKKKKSFFTRSNMHVQVNYIVKLTATCTSFIPEILLFIC